MANKGIFAGFDNENETKNSSAVSASSEIKSSMKSMRSYLDTHSKGKWVEKWTTSDNLSISWSSKRQYKEKQQPDGHGYELVFSVRALVPQKFSVEEELMHVKHVEVKSPHVGVMW
ncbi:hypothetical protein TNCV_2448561 [Trichonephila clavipes]|uniref:Uncharacterized protein n=1 Tax=Trichonephila clavipes TaxID=2585209 RepID=A0A8X6VN04_TRICX|nr:hypothetical protein TNCV_2448561 [Trichonephila clavipes]